MVALRLENVLSIEKAMSNFRIARLSRPQLERPLNLKEREKEGNVDYLD